ncbi:MAG: ABC-2 type transporter [candidate division WS1 bacterium]|jgi:ABC-2 type transport system permease protein|nr:ABC-2 type transporter [candidate division WS1 bacterium]
MRPYIAVLSANFRMMLQYRAAAFAGAVTQVFWGLIRVMVFEAFYRSSSLVHPMGLDEVVDYVWLGQAMLLLTTFGPDPHIREMIRSGNVAYELTRPTDLYGFWYVRCLAARSAPVILRAVPQLLIAGLFFGLRAPASPASGAAWIASTLAAMLLSAAFGAVISITLLWTISGEGASRFLPAVSWLLSGNIIPLPLFPEWAQGVLNVLPFRGLADTPFRIYMGHIGPGEALLPILHQVVWAAAFVLFGRWLLARAMRRVVVQGG